MKRALEIAAAGGHNLIIFGPPGAGKTMLTKRITTNLPSSSTCTNCAVKRSVKIYEYTLLNQATPSNNSPVFSDSFSTHLVAQVDTDDNGFFQTSIAAGHYTIVILENGKLYTNGSDGQGGLNPITYSSGKQNVNLTMTYMAVF